MAADARVAAHPAKPGIPARLARLTGRRRALMAFLLGALLTLAMPPLFVLPAAFVAFAGFLWLLDGARAAARPVRAALVAGWWFGFGHFVPGIYWIANSMLVDAAEFGWMIPFAIGGLSAYLAIFPALAAAAYGAARGPRLARILIFAAAWTATEYLRGTVLTGFPWNLVATVWTFAPIAMQSAAFLGAYGLGLASVLLFCAPAAFGADRGKRFRQDMLALAVAGSLPLAAGAARIVTADPVTMTPEVKLALIQGNIPQRMKWQPEERARIVRTYLDLTAEAVANGATHVVWPETAVPVALGRAADVREAIASILTDGRAKALIAGTIRLNAPDERPLKAWNSVQTFDGGGRIVSTFDKFHLVPFGEYVPLRRWVPIEAIAGGGFDFMAGVGPQTITVPGLPPVGPLVCYEVIFPAAVTAPGARPGLLLNVTNDAWFGDSTGPRQHFAAARLRAVEEGLPLVRAAGTGISAIIDPYGRILARLDLDREGVVTGPLPEPLPPTLFARLGNGLALALAALAAALGLWHARRA